ncbi:MAG: hypothetical protein WDN44_03605 [Sphingomonas sp.]
MLDREGIPLFVGEAPTACRDIAAGLADWRPDLVHGVPMGRLLLEWIDGGHLPGCPRVATETSEASARCTWYAPEVFARLDGVDAVIAPCASVAAGVRGAFRLHGSDRDDPACGSSAGGCGPDRCAPRISAR